MDAIRKIEAAEPAAWQFRQFYRGEGDDGWGEWQDCRGQDVAYFRKRSATEPDTFEVRPLYTAQTLASKEAELAEAGLKYVSLFGELQNAMGEIARLNKAFRDCMALMGPKAPPCCQGCEYEWTAALKIISAALTTTPQPTE